MTKTLSILSLLILYSFCGNKDKAAAPKLENHVKHEVPKAEQEVAQKPAITTISEKTKAKFTYHLNVPELSMNLASSLLEISGLSYDYTEDVLLAINDEKGRVYSIDKENGEIINYSKFGKKGDYEGIEKVGDEIYVTNSSGTLFAIKLSLEIESTKIRTSLREINDVEGLAYDSKTQSLLLACKGKSNLLASQNFKKTKAIYSYKIKDSTLVEEPFMTIKDQDLELFVDQDKTHDDLTPEELKKLKKRVKSFSPSGIAIHPEQDLFYIISSVGKSMIILDRSSQIQSIQFLDATIHRQPEGICFDKSSNLYISNEGKLGLAKIYKFSPS